MVSILVKQIRYKIVSAFVTLMLVVCVIAWLYKVFNFQDRTRAYESYTVSSDAVMSNSVSNKRVFAEEEEKREAYLEAQRQESEFTKAKLKKEMSNECQFWKLQKKMGKSTVAGAKVNQYCYVNTKTSQKNL